jgi:hypothetical protein
MDNNLPTIAGINNVARALKVPIDCYDEDDADGIAVLRECRELMNTSREQLIGILIRFGRMEIKIPKRLNGITTDTLRLFAAICNVHANKNGTQGGRGPRQPPRYKGSTANVLDGSEPE